MGCCERPCYGRLFCFVYTKYDTPIGSTSRSYLNKHLLFFIKGLSAKVIRAHNTLITFQSQLEGTPKNGTMREKLNYYNHASRMVLILCNCQHAVPERHGQSIAEMKEYG